MPALTLGHATPISGKELSESHTDMVDFCVRAGKVYDPANGIDGEVKDIWIDRGRIVAAPSDAMAAKTLDARGYIVFPGGVDMHTHLVGPKVNAARGLRPEERRGDGGGASVPTTYLTGCKYAGLGFTTAMDAAVAPMFARQAHLELADTPCIDKGFLALVADHHAVLDAIRDGDRDRLDQFLAWLINATGAFGCKAVNPGGVEQWKETGRRTLVDLDATIDHFKVSPSAILRELAASIERLSLPHPLHVHCNNLGVGGNWTTTSAALEALGASRAHLAHAQFHSYDGAPDDDGSIASAVPKLIDVLKGKPNISLDVGHVTFGATTSLTGDGPLGLFLHCVGGAKWFSADVECEGGCGIVPIEYKHQSLFHSVQWAAGLEWYLLMDEPWRIALSTDHPNGGVFWRYPETLALLMSRDLRRKKIAELHPKLRERSVLADLGREYSLFEVAMLTRAAPARILGLAHKGHLGPGADADLVLYQPADDVERLFSFPRFVVKAGRIIVDDGELRETPAGETIAADVPPTNADSDRRRFPDGYSVEFENYAMNRERLVDRRSSPHVVGQAGR